MSITTEIQRIKDNIANTYTALGEKGATIPELQNSANLANTVSTITTGGGSGGFAPTYTNGWERPASFDFVNNIVKNFDINNMSGFSTGGDSNTAEYVIGYVLHENQLTVCQWNDGVVAYKIPEGATATVNGSGVCVFDFSNCEERWLIIVSHALIYTLYSPDISAGGNGRPQSGMESRHHRYVCINKITDGIGSVSVADFRRFVYNYINESAISIEDFDTYNIKINTTINIQSATDIGNWVCPSLKYHKKMFDLTNNTESIYEKVLSTSVSEAFLNSYSEMLGRCYDFPFILDLSARTSTSKLFLVGSRYEKKEVPFIRNLKIKLPSNCDVSFACGWYDYGSMFPLLNIESLRYMAENAPTVSNKGISIGYNNLFHLNSYAPEVVTTFTNKGWSVRTS